MLPAWKIFNHETIRLLTFKVKCNKMDFGKFWVWHVAACTLFSSWKKCGILRTYVQLWCMVQTCCAWMRLWRVMAQRQDHPSSSHLPATPAVQQAPSKPWNRWKQDQTKQLRSCIVVTTASSGSCSAQSMQQLKSSPKANRARSWGRERGHRFAFV